MCFNFLYLKWSISSLLHFESWLSKFCAFFRWWSNSFSSHTCVILLPTLQFLTNITILQLFGIFLVPILRNRSYFVIFHNTTQLFQEHFIKESLPFPLIWDSVFSIYLISTCNYAYFWIFYFVPLVYLCIHEPISCYFNYRLYHCNNNLKYFMHGRNSPTFYLNHLYSFLQGFYSHSCLFFFFKSTLYLPSLASENVLMFYWDDLSL